MRDYLQANFTDTNLETFLNVINFGDNGYGACKGFADEDTSNAAIMGPAHSIMAFIGEMAREGDDSLASITTLSPIMQKAHGLPKPSPKRKESDA